MSRGIVMETGSKHVIVMMPDGQFRKVRTALKPEIGEEFTFSEQRRMQRPRKLYSFSAGAAAIVLVLFAPLLAQQFSKPSSVVAYLTMDVNPSIELGINKDEQVEELRPINVDGEKVTKDLKYKGLPLQTVTEAIMDRISAGPYLNSGEGDVVITSVAVQDVMKPAEEINLTAHMDSAVRKSLAKTDKGRKLQVEVTTLSAPKEVREEAKREGVSSGKMAFYLMAKEQGYRISIDNLKKESIHQAAKKMGGVAAIMNGRDSEDNEAKNSGPSASAPVKQQTLKPQPAKSDASKEAEKEAQLEKQKKQLEALVKHEQEKHGAHKGNKDDGRGTNGESDSGRILQQGGFINVMEHSPGNNGGGHDSVSKGGQKKDDNDKPPSKAPSHQQSHIGSNPSKDSGSKVKGGGEEAKKASDSRPSGVIQGSGAMVGMHAGSSTGNMFSDTRDQDKDKREDTSKDNNNINSKGTSKNKGSASSRDNDKDKSRNNDQNRGSANEDKGKDTRKSNDNGMNNGNDDSNRKGSGGSDRANNDSDNLRGR
ncbi:anti-sigma factor domain-containing protein [Paenibacillus sacheonensis]|uniref:Anti-sigma factor domain-containing protein n=1 Tax=Paenibacillus sacheonensis TaxID=742054 RepID=A0A7X5C095_9BACL|nr:anti-sigma factor domain-containing protein [Paenibacillus sacheonensis]MBM7566870.1 hypothetical protein [Paenibacillus sacheonensis]NBC71492.1 anti-sigma factor domain-containing protein [Paenibacillus sacheonensis]